jgi:hemoglobin/transferrin/lactoferrin receptor protein
LNFGNRNRVFRTFLIVSTAIAPLISIPAAYAQENGANALTRRPYNIPAQSLTGALTTFARTSGVKIAYPAELARGKFAPAVSGPLTPQGALERILSNSGLSYSFSSSDNVRIFDASAGSSNGSVSADGATVLETIRVTGTKGRPSDAPYETAGSSAYISGEQLARVPAASAGDLLVGIPGVISAGSRVGASINPNIRGLQGAGRVNTTVDGARQTTSSYRGYIGNRDEVYVDPDMIAGIDISKGPSSGVGAGGIGGTINFRTLEAGDIIKEGRNYGLRVKTDIGSNTSKIPASGTAPSYDRPSFVDDSSWSGSVAAATTQESFDLIGVYSRRKQGNYYAGTKVPDGITFGTTTAANGTVRPGQEALNTSQDTTSFMTKGTLRWGDVHSLELGFLRYDSKYGEVDELSFGPWIPQKQMPITHTIVDTYTARYHYAPEDNPYVDFRANFWISDLDVDRQVQGWLPYGMFTRGGDISNTSSFETGIGALTWQNGFEVIDEDAHATAFMSFGVPMSFGPIGQRTIVSGFSKAKLEVTDWLTLNAGGRYDHYSSEAGDYLSSHPAQSGSRFNPNVSITLEPLDGLQFYGLYTEGYRPPSLRESHWNYGVILQVNPDLEPELAKNIEFGVNVLKEGIISAGDTLRLKASVFNNKYENYIVRLRPPDWTFGYQWDNIDHARYRGVELAASYDAGSYFLEGNYTRYTDIKYCQTSTSCTSFGLGQDYGANYVPPTHSGSVTAGFRAFDDALTLGARTHFASERAGGKTLNGGFATAMTWPRYTILDLFGSYDFKDDLKLSFSAENIFDRYYIGALSSVGMPAPGRTFRMSLTKTF